MEFLMTLIIFPIISFLFGVIGQILIKKTYIVVGIMFLGWLIATFTIFNGTFLIWVFVYSALSFLGSGAVYFFKERKSK
jgi:Protein of unknown function (DUF2651)